MNVVKKIILATIACSGVALASPAFSTVYIKQVCPTAGSNLQCKVYGLPTTVKAGNYLYTWLISTIGNPTGKYAATLNGVKLSPAAVAGVLEHFAFNLTHIQPL